MPLVRSVRGNWSCFVCNSHSSSHVLNGRKWDIGGRQKPPYGLESLQVNQQCHLGRGCSRNAWRPLALIETRIEKLLQIALGQRIR